MEFNAICTESERLKFYDCDYLGRMKISAILKLSAELAGYDYTVKGFSHEMLWEQDMVFLLSKISLKIFSYPTAQKTLTSSTWESGKKGALFMRGTDISADEKIAVSISSGWILANPKTRHIYKPSAFDSKMPQLLDKEISALPIGKIQAESLLPVGKREVRISDLDENGHVYNANYADIAADFLPKELFEKPLDNFRINYIGEAVFGDVIDIYSVVTENKAVIIGKVCEKACFETEFIWK